MSERGANSYDRAVDAILRGLSEVVPGLAAPDQQTALLGEGAVLDSLGFVTLLVAVEQRLDGSIDLAGSFLEVGSPDDPGNPFRTVGSLARHVVELAKPEPQP